MNQLKIEQTSVYWCFLNLFFKKQISKIVFYFVEQDDLKYIFILKGLNIIAPWWFGVSMQYVHLLEWQMWNLYIKARIIYTLSYLVSNKKE